MIYSLLTNKQGLIVWGGESSTDYGMVVSEPPAYDKPLRKQTIYNVPGRNGAILIDEGAYEDTTRKYKVFVLAAEEEDSGGVITGTLAEKVSDLSTWLYSKHGYTRLEDNFEPDIYRLAYYSGGNEFLNRLVQAGSAELTFTCRAERFLKSGETATVYTNGDTITNPTKFTAKPLIHIEGSGTVTVQLGGNTITAVLGTSDYIDIDCDRMNAYKGATNKNDKISGDFPVIKSGANTLATTGTITKLTIKPNYYVI